MSDTDRTPSTGNWIAGALIACAVLLFIYKPAAFAVILGLLAYGLRKFLGLFFR